MTRRGWIIFAAFAAVDGLDLALTIRNHLEYRAGPGAVTVMPLGQLLGWATSGAILLALIGVLVSVIRARRDRSHARAMLRRAAATDLAGARRRSDQPER